MWRLEELGEGFQVDPGTGLKASLLAKKSILQLPGGLASLPATLRMDGHSTSQSS